MASESSRPRVGQRGAPLQVLHLCNHVICVGKPAGVPVVPDSSGDESLFDLTKAWIRAEFRKPGDVFVGVVHRLDRPVSGVVAFARTSKGAARLTESFRSKAARKTYVAVTTSPVPEAGEIRHWLLKEGTKNRVGVVPEGTPGAKLAHSRYRRVRSHSAGGSHVELEPVTGRSHQLRVAMASLGAPLRGDLKYGAPDALPDKSIALHAKRLVLPHPTRDEFVDVSLEPPIWD